MQAAGAAVVAGLGGGVGSAAGGAAGAAVGSKMGDALNSLSDSIAASSPTGNADIDKTLGNIVANVVATGAGAVGGGAGAFSSYDVDRFNRSMHDNTADKQPEKSLMAKVCPAGAQCSDAVVQAAVQAQGANAQQALDSMEPNYATVGGSVLSGTIGGAVNLRDGTTYASAGVAQMLPAPSWAPSFAGTFGWIFGASGANATNSFLNGDGLQVSVSVPTGLPINFVGAITHAYGGATAFEVGAGSPGPISGAITPWSHSTPVINSKR